MQLLYDSQQLFTIKIVSTLRLPPPRAAGRKREMDLYATTLPYLLLQENVCLGWNLIIRALFLHPTPDDCSRKRILIKAQEQEQASSGCGRWDSWRGQCKWLDKYLIQSYCVHQGQEIPDHFPAQGHNPSINQFPLMLHNAWCSLLAPAP